MPTALEASIREDTLIQGLIEAKGKLIEVIAFGISYTGTLKAVDVKSGYITILDGDDQAMLEFERIESFRVLE